MSIKDLIKEHLVFPVVTAVTLGGGAAIVQNRVELAQHDVRINRIEKLDESMSKLSDKLDETRETLATVKARQEK